MHFCRPGKTHLQSFKKTGLKLYVNLQSQGTHCLYIWGQKMTKFKKVQKMIKIKARIIWKAHAHLQTMENTCAKFQKDWCKIVWYIEGEKWLNSQCVENSEKIQKKDLTVISKPHAHPHTMKTTHAKFHNNRYKTVTGVALTGGTNCL